MDSNALSLLQAANRIIIAYSGGVDSTVLLHQLSQQPQLSKKCLAVHINHGLQAEAGQWQQHCQQICEQFSIEYQSVNVEISTKKRDSLEARARQARYAALAEFIQYGDVLVTAQHQDDQAETILLQLLRGAGVKGLAAMPVVTDFSAGQLLRPLLSASQAELTEYAKQHQLVWIDDPSNEDINFDRNYLRHQIMPFLLERWPQAINNLARSAEHCAEADSLLQQFAESLLAKEQLIDCHPAVIELMNYQPLALANFVDLSLVEQKNLIRHWLAKQGFNLPSRAILLKILKEIIEASDDAEPIVAWGDVEIRRYQQALYAMPKLRDFDDQEQLFWDGTTEIDTAIGILSKMDLPKPVVITYRQGGERFHPADRDKSQTLKKLMQEWLIPPWLRDRWPLLYRNGELVVVYAIANAKNYL